MGEILKLENITKKFGKTIALDGISLSVNEGEFISFLGPSGCGKTTMLRIIAGLCEADTGEVFLRGNDITVLPPEKRAVNTVFQSYALFPHMTVEANIGYGLKIRNFKKSEIKEQTEKMLELVRLSGVNKKYPHQLSGGQKQRVAIARGLINKPEILLLDEPMGALDLQLRRHLSEEIKRIQKESGITFIYITHDRDEAMNMSDRMIIMNEGKFVQEGTPDTIYNSPSNRFAAEFIGLSNIIKTVFKNEKINICGKEFPVEFQTENEKSIHVCIRSENVLISKSEPGIEAVVSDKSYSGGFIRLTCTLPDGTVITGVREDKQSEINIGEKVFVNPDSRFFSLIKG